MIDLGHVAPHEAELIFRNGADRQFNFINYQPACIEHLTQQQANDLVAIYNGTVTHSRIYDQHTPLMNMLKTEEIDTIDFEPINHVLKDIFHTDYPMFFDLITILASMLEAKDTLNMCVFIDDIYNKFMAPQTETVEEVEDGETAAPVEVADDYVTIDEDVETVEEGESAEPEVTPKHESLTEEEAHIGENGEEENEEMEELSSIL